MTNDHTSGPTPGADNVTLNLAQIEDYGVLVHALSNYAEEMRRGGDDEAARVAQGDAHSDPDMVNNAYELANRAEEMRVTIEEQVAANELARA